MKKRLAAFMCLLIIMGLLPLAVVGISGIKSAQPLSATPDSAVAETSDGADKAETVCAKAAEMCETNFCDEAVKAAVIIANTNVSVLNEDKKSDYNSDKELYNRAVNAYNSVRELYITYKDEKSYIPYSFCSNGNTVKSGKYEYIQPVASPWDRLSDQYSADLECEGVSLYGIDHLCKNGYTAEQALKWYLPKVEIKIL